MSRYRKYTDNFPSMLKALRLTGENGPGINFDPLSKDDYQDIIEKDKARDIILELRDPHTHSTEKTKDRLYNMDNYQNFPYYGQGEMTANAVYFMFTMNPKLVQIYNDHGDVNFKAYMGFAYIDDTDVPCGLSINRFGHEPNAQYTITVFRNTLAPYEEREVTFICSENIVADDYYTGLHGAHHEQPLSGPQIMRSIRSAIGSEKIQQLVQSIFHENGQISEERYERLNTRLLHHNLDNRDLLTPQIPRIMENVKQLDGKIARKIQRYYTANNLDFFEYHHYKQFLKDLILQAETQTPQKPAVTKAFKELYLEFLMIHFFYRVDKSGRTAYLKDGLEKKRSEKDKESAMDTLKAEYTSALQDPNIDSDEFTKKINQSYRSLHYHSLIEKLEKSIQNSNSPTKNIAIAQLPFLQKLNFTKLTPAKQQTAMAFVTELISFTETPQQASFDPLQKLYPKVHLDPKELEPIKQILEEELFVRQITALEKNIATCRHPYLKAEAEKKLRYLKNITFNDQPNIRQMHINSLLETLNRFIESNRPEILNKLEILYDQLNFIPIEPEKANTLLQPIPIADMHQQIEQHNCTFDPQGRALVTTISSEQNAELVTWNLDIADVQTTDVAEQFYQMLSTTLKKQASPAVVANILALLNRNKTAIYPLQQVLQMYLNQIAQTYQTALQTEGVTSQMMQASLLATAQRLNVTVLNHLASGLINASIRNGTMLKQLDMVTLNNSLIETQDDLRKNGRIMLLEHLRAQIHQQKQRQPTATVSTAKIISNKMVYFDTRQSLATEITTIQPDLAYSFRQIQTYRCTGTNFKSSDEIRRSRVHSTALHLPESMSNPDYQTQFKDRLTQISDSCHYRTNPPITYYVYAATNAQIQQTLAAAHHYNRTVIQQNPRHEPLCWVQTYDPAESDKTLGYPMLDWSGAISDQTLMLEMSLCSQIAAIDANQALNLQAYIDFLNPASSYVRGLLKSKVFAFTSEGKNIRDQIHALKIVWQQDKNLDEDLGNQKFTTKTLQKLIAFDLHHLPDYALLVQTMSLTIGKQTLLNDESSGKALADTLGHAQIFDLIPLPDSIQGPFIMLLRAVDKQTAILAADELNKAMQAYVASNQNATAVATMLPIMEQQAHFAQATTSTHAMQQVKTYLLTPPPLEASSNARSKTRKGPEIETASPQRQAKTRHPATNSSNQRDRLFAAKREAAKRDATNTEESESLLSTAARNKARSFRK